MTSQFCLHNPTLALRIVRPIRMMKGLDYACVLLSNVTNVLGKKILYNHHYFQRILKREMSSSFCSDLLWIASSSGTQRKCYKFYHLSWTNTISQPISLQWGWESCASFTLQNLNKSQNGMHVKIHKSHKRQERKRISSVFFQEVEGKRDGRQKRNICPTAVEVEPFQ